MKNNKYYFLLKPWHFLISMMVFFLFTLIVEQIKISHMPPSISTNNLANALDLSEQDNLSFILVHDEQSKESSIMRYNMQLLAEKKSNNVGFYEVNGLQNPEFCCKHSISSLPNVLVINDNKELLRLMGLISFDNLNLIYSDLCKKIIHK